MDEWHDTTTSNGRRLDKHVQFLVVADGNLQVTGGDTLHLVIFGYVSGQFQDFGSQVLQDGSTVDGGGRSDTTSRVRVGLEVSVDTTNGELKTSSLTSGLRLGTGSLGGSLSFGGFARLGVIRHLSGEFSERGGGAYLEVDGSRKEEINPPKQPRTKNQKAHQRLVLLVADWSKKWKVFREN